MSVKWWPFHSGKCGASENNTHFLSFQMIVAETRATHWQGLAASSPKVTCTWWSVAALLTPITGLSPDRKGPQPTRTGGAISTETDDLSTQGNCLQIQFAEVFLGSTYTQFCWLWLKNIAFLHRQLYKILRKESDIPRNIVHIFITWKDQYCCIFIYLFREHF